MCQVDLGWTVKSSAPIYRLEAKINTSLVHVCELLFEDYCALLSPEELSMHNSVDQIAKMLGKIWTLNEPQKIVLFDILQACP